MSTSCSTEKCPKCGKESLFVDYDCRTGEYDTFCEFCGFGQHFSWIRDENFDIVREDKIYPLSEVFLVVRNYNNDEFYLQKAVTEIKGFNTDMIDCYLNHCDGYRFDEYDEGINNFYWISGEKVERLYSLGNELEVLDDKMIVHEIKIEFEELGGFGHILFFTDTASEEIRFEENTTREAAIAVIEEVKNRSGVKEILATWYNPEIKEYEILYGEYREFDESYPVYDTPYEDNTSEDDLPF